METSPVNTNRQQKKLMKIFIFSSVFFCHKFLMDLEPSQKFIECPWITALQEHRCCPETEDLADLPEDPEDLPAQI